MKKCEFGLRVEGTGESLERRKVSSFRVQSTFQGIFGDRVYFGLQGIFWKGPKKEKKKQHSISTSHYRGREKDKERRIKRVLKDTEEKQQVYPSIKYLYIFLFLSWLIFFLFPRLIFQTIPLVLYFKTYYGSNKLQWVGLGTYDH